MDTREAERLYQKYFSAVYRICFLYMKQEADTFDMVQETFLRLLRSHPVFESDEKAKAWLILYRVFQAFG